MSGCADTDADMLDASNAVVEGSGDAQFFHVAHRVNGNIEPFRPPRYSSPPSNAYQDRDELMLDEHQDWPWSSGIDDRIASFNGLHDMMGMTEEMYTTTSSSSQSSISSRIPRAGPSSGSLRSPTASQPRPANVLGTSSPETHQPLEMPALTEGDPRWMKVRKLILKGMHLGKHAKKAKGVVRERVRVELDRAKLTPQNFSKMLKKIKEKLAPERVQSAVAASQRILDEHLEESGFGAAESQNQQVAQVREAVQRVWDRGITTNVQEVEFILECFREAQTN
ncbi:hypothetical protein B0H65DRAFT_207538 [Neurospora tetraspora]|uniref:Uncharacterized protein n=1 Tax=Neurospora tetraspora TaxID=94610 RepID=A0AAE0MRX1_9PEZI|nr:hypothetical protein B0H65DRAFT_207538 [Neurospora tetraspora]